MIKPLDSRSSLWHTLFMDKVSSKAKHRVNRRIAVRPTNEDIMSTPTQAIAITAEKNVFDLVSKKYVTLEKEGETTPVTTMQEFTERLGNRADLILELANKALAEYAKEQLAADETKPWMLRDDEELVPFEGQALSADKAKTLQASVINFAKLLFGYSKNMVPGDKEANIKAKNEAKDQALAAILSAPGAVERLK